MEAREYRDLMTALTKGIGASAESFTSLGRFHSLFACSLYPTGMGTDDNYFRVEADTLDELYAAVVQKWDAMRETFRQRVIRDMALEIIRITADQGVCSDTALRLKYNLADVIAFGLDACREADEIAGKGPFAIVVLAAPNAPAVLDPDEMPF